MLKGTGISIASVLTMLFSHSIQTGKLPLAWKASNILPIPKESIRTMHLQTNLVVIHHYWTVGKNHNDRVIAYLECTYPPTQNQQGFLPGKSTTSDSYSLCNPWLVYSLGIRQGNGFSVLTKGFNSVPHQQLFAKLKAIGLNAYLINCIKNYLTHRMQCVVLNGVSS